MYRIPRKTLTARNYNYDMPVSPLREIKSLGKIAWYDSSNLADYVRPIRDSIFADTVRSYFDIPLERLSKEQFNELNNDSTLEYDPNYTQEDFERISYKRKRLRELDYIISKSKNGLPTKATGLATSMITSNITPINMGVNVATGLMPISAIAKGIWWLANPVKSKAIQMGIGGAVGQAMVEPIEYMSHQYDQRPYDLKDSALNVAVSAGFSGAIPFAGYGIKSVVKGGRLKYNEFKKSYLTTPEELHTEYRTGNEALDIQLKYHLNELGDKTAPEGYNNVEMSVKDISESQVKLYEEFKKYYPEFYELQENIAQLETEAHQTYKTGNDVNLLPKHEQKKLVKLKRELYKVAESLSGDEGFINSQKQLTDTNNLLLHKLKEEQHIKEGYNIDPNELKIAITQLEDGNYIDLSDPTNPKSIYENDFKHTEQIQLTENINYLEKKLNIKRDFEKDFDNVNYFDKLLYEEKAAAARRLIANSKNEAKGFKELIGRADLEGLQRSQQYVFKLADELKADNVLEYFHNKNFHHAIRQELWNKTHRRKKDSGSPIARKIADIVHELQQSQINELRNQNIHVGLVEGYITKQTHDPNKLKGNRKEWVEFVRERLDWDRVEADLDLDEVFTNLASSDHNKDISSKGIRDLEEYFTSERKLHFKSADAASAYHDKYGRYDLNTNIVNNLDKLAYNMGLINNLTTNPFEFIGKLKNDVKKQIAPVVAGNKKSKKDKILNYFKGGDLNERLEQLMGHTYDNPTLAKVAGVVKGLNNMACLGNVVMTSFADIGTVSSVYVRNGLPVMSSFTDSLKAATHGMSSKDKTELGRSLAIGVETQVGTLFNRFSGDGLVFDKVSGLTQGYMKMTLLPYWDNSVKTSVGMMLSNHGAVNAKLSYKNANSDLKAQLLQYGIGKGEWEALRSFIKKAEDGNEYIIIPFGDKLTPRQRDVGTKYRNYLTDNVDTAVTTPHFNEQYASRLGMRKGSKLGIAVDLIMQYKNFTLALFMRSLKNPLSNVLPLSVLVVNGMIAQHLQLSARKLLRGEELSAPTQEDAVKAFTGGSGLGYFAEFFFHEHNKYGRGIFSEMKGVTGAKIEDVLSSLTDYSQGNTDKANRKLKRTAIQMIPGRNLFYLQASLRAGGVPQEWIDEWLNGRVVKKSHR